MSNSIHSDALRTVRVSGRRFEASPFQEFWFNENTVMGVYAGRYYPVFNGDDIAETYWKLRREAALYDVPERPVEVSGPDAVPFLERVFSRRVSDLKSGRGRYAIALTPQGRLFMDGILFRLSDDRFWYVQPDGPLEAWLLAHSGGYRVNISDPHSRVLQIQGPLSVEVMRAASDGAIDEGLGYFHAGFFQIGGQEVYVSRTGWTGELGFEIYTLGKATDCRRLWEHLFATGRPHGLTFSSISSMEIRRIEAGILDSGTDFDVSMTPFDAGLDTFVNLDKDDFVGRAALRDAPRGKRLFGLKCAAATPGYKGDVMHGDVVVGQVTAGAWSPYLGAGIGYVRFREAGAWIGQMLSVRSDRDELVPCEILDLPFYDPEKRIPRGIDKTIPPLTED